MDLPELLAVLESPDFVGPAHRMIEGRRESDLATATNILRGSEEAKAPLPWPISMQKLRMHCDLAGDWWPRPRNWFRRYAFLDVDFSCTSERFA